MKNYFTYMFKSKNNIRKLSILYMLVFITVLVGNLAVMYNPINMFGKISPLFFIFIAGTILLATLPCGYLISCIKNFMDKSDNLPDFGYKNILISGIKMLLSISLLLSATLLIFYIFGYLSNFFVKHNLIPFAFIIAALTFLFTIIVLFILAAGFYNFSKTQDIFAFIRLPKLFELIDKNINNYFKYFILYVILLGLTIFIKSSLFVHLIGSGYIGLILYSFILSAIFQYTSLVFAKIVISSVTKE